MYRSEAASPEKWRSKRRNTSPVRSDCESTNWTEQRNNIGIFPSTMPSRPLSRSHKRGTSLIEQGNTGNHQQRRIASDEDEINQRFSLTNGLVASLLENTGAHGIPNIKRAPNIFRRLMWTVLFLTGLAMFIWQSSWLLNRYYMYGVDIKLEISNDRMIEFPAVTVCNLNGIRSDFFEELVEDGGELPTSLSGPIQGLFGTDSDTDVDEQFQMIEDAVELVGQLDYNDRRMTGHQLEHMLLRCVFQGKSCNASDFTHFYHYLYGNCYIFNSASKATKRRFVTNAGPLYGLTLEMYIEQDQYISNIQPAAGARVAVHAQRQMPFPENEGVSVSPGQETSIGIKRTNYTRLGHPYTNCTSSDVNGTKTIFNLALPDTKYSQRACENNCFYQDLIGECGCTSASLRFNDSIPLCNSAQDSCLDSVEMRYLGGKLDCKCTSPCRELEYEFNIGQARWPNEKLKPFLLSSVRNFSDDLEEDIDSDADVDFLEKNVLKLNVYYDKIEYMTIYHDKAYDEIALLSDMGGNVGLWIGVSVLTVFEFIELAYDLCKLIVYRIVSKNGGTATTRSGKVTSSDIDLQHVSDLKVDNGEQKHVDYEHGS